MFVKHNHKKNLLSGQSGQLVVISGELESLEQIPST